MKYLAPIHPEHIPAVAFPLDRCVYCWYTMQPALPFPATWSSTCCPAHRMWVLAQYGQKKAVASSKRAGSVDLAVPLSRQVQAMEERP